MHPLWNTGIDDRGVDRVVVALNSQFAPPALCAVLVVGPLASACCTVPDLVSGIYLVCVFTRRVQCVFAPFVTRYSAICGTAPSGVLYCT